jgi:hypothetical protein
MRRLALLLAVIASARVLAQNDLDPRAAAADEEQAFAAIDKEQWCQAARLFERAHSRGPAVDLLMNAAQAAEYGGDLAGALAFVDAVKGLSGVDAARKKAAAARSAELKKRVSKQGGGSPCPALPPPETTTTTTTTTTAPPPLPVPPPPAVEEPLDLGPAAFAGAGVGGGVVLVGASMATVGLLPWFAHDSASTQILVAERAKADATGLQQKQAEARAGWESYGQPLTVAGAVVTSIGLVAVVGGLAIGFLGASAANE